MVLHRRSNHFAELHCLWNEETNYGLKTIRAKSSGTTKHHGECAFGVGGFQKGRCALTNSSQKAVGAHLCAIVNLDKLFVLATFEDVYLTKIYLHFLTRNGGNKRNTTGFTLLKFGRSLAIGPAIVVKVDGCFAHFHALRRKFHEHIFIIC